MGPETYNLGKALTNARLAHQQFEDILRTLDGRSKAKRFLKEATRMLKRIEIDFKHCIGDENYKSIINDQLLNDECAGQIDVITDYILELPKGIRDEIEDYIEKRWEVYKIK